MSIEGFLANYGLPAIFAGCFAEGETAAVLSGIAGHAAGLRWPVIAVTAAAGAFTSDQLWFLLARHAPDRGLIHRFRQKAAQTPRLQALGKHRIALTLAFRFLPGTRILAPVLLSQTAMPWLVYLALTAMVCSIWAGVFTLIGFHFGRAAEGYLQSGHGHFVAMLVVLAVAVLGYILRKHHNAKRTTKE